MPHLSWSRKALLDVQRVHRFLAVKDRAAANRAVAAIRRGVLPLSNFPNLGQAAPELGPSYRRWIVRFGSHGYVLIYRIDQDALTLLSLHHQKELQTPDGP